MKLRSRLALTIAILVVPLAFLIAWAQSGARERAFEEAVRAEIVGEMEAGGRIACEEAPGAWGTPPRRGFGRRRPHRPPRGRNLFAYDVAFQPASPRAPAFPAELREAIESGEEVASIPGPLAARRGGRGRLVAVRMPWSEGPCAIVLAQRVGPGQGDGFLRTLVPVLLVSAAAVLLAVVAAGPIVARIRRLIAAVRAPGDAPIDLAGRDELGELAAAFESRRAELRRRVTEIEGRDRTLRRFVANTTHDVMIPLTVIQGHLAALERAAVADRPADPTRIAAALEECHYLASLLENLALVAKLETGETPGERHPVDLSALVARVATRHVTFARQREVELAHAVPHETITVTGDVTFLEQAASNLVHNAIRYNRPGGHVAVLLERTSRDRFTLSVADDGPGLSDEELARVTERGFRGERARTRDPHGLGLGLAIVSEVASLHGFELRFERPPEGGLRVELSGPTW